jgi:hypothetical protein
VSDYLFGERYFATRERLSHVIRGILTLAGETQTALGDVFTPARIESELGRPFIFIACGEINAGKSSLLNSLFGHDLCPADVLPTTDRFHYYRHGPADLNHPRGPDREERLRTAGFLRHFHLIDTPGTNSGKAQHAASLVQLAGASDLILCVFPVANPWGAATWDFLSRLSDEVLARVVLLVQQADLREPGDLDVIRGHMADLAMKRLGRVPPIFAVSAKLARMAKRGKMLDVGLHEASGFTALEAFIGRVVCFSAARRGMLETWRGHSAAALRMVEDRIEEQQRDIRTHSRFIADVEQEVIGIREQFVARLPRHLVNVAEVFETEAVGITRLLRKRLGALRSLLRLFTGDHTGQDMETAFIARLQQTIEAVAAKDGGEVVKVCAEHWEELAGRVKSALGADLAAAGPVDGILTEARERFIRRLGGAARQGIGDLRVRSLLDKDLRKRNLALRSFTISALLLTTAGASSGAMQLPWLPVVLCGLAALFLTGGFVVAWITRRTISRDFRQRLLDTCGAFASTLHSDYEEALHEVFRDYSSAMAILHHYHAGERSAIEPRQRRWQELFLTLKAIEQDL